LEAADKGIYPLVGIAEKLLATADGQIDDSVEGDAMNGDCDIGAVV